VVDDEASVAEEPVAGPSTGYRRNWTLGLLDEANEGDEEEYGRARRQKRRVMRSSPQPGPSRRREPLPRASTSKQAEEKATQERPALEDEKWIFEDGKSIAYARIPFLIMLFFQQASPRRSCPKLSLKSRR
jgi:hypothetical protein